MEILVNPLQKTVICLLRFWWFCYWATENKSVFLHVNLHLLHRFKPSFFPLLSLHCFLVISAWVRRVSVMNSHFELRENWFCDDDSVLNRWESMSNQRNFVEFCWIWCFCVDSVEINGGLRWLGFLPLMNLWSFLLILFWSNRKERESWILFWWVGVWLWLCVALCTFYSMTCVPLNKWESDTWTWKKEWHGLVQKMDFSAKNNT